MHEHAARFDRQGGNPGVVYGYGSSRFLQVQKNIAEDLDRFTGGKKAFDGFQGLKFFHNGAIYGFWPGGSMAG